jgi:hypothetical protein
MVELFEELTTVDLRGLRDETLVEALQATVGLSDRLGTFVGCLAARLDQTGAALRAVGTDVADVLSGDGRMTRRQAQALVNSGKQVSRCGAASEAALEGRIGRRQAEAVAAQARETSRVLSGSEVDQLDKVLTNYAEGLGATPGAGETGAEDPCDGDATDEASTEVGRFGPDGLRVLGRRLFRWLAPDAVDATEEAQVEREHRLAVAEQGLWFSTAGDGSVRFRGRLPMLEGSLFRRVVDAHVDELKPSLNADDREDPSLRRDPEMLRAMGLMAWVERTTMEAGEAAAVSHAAGTVRDGGQSSGVAGVTSTATAGHGENGRVGTPAGDAAVDVDDLADPEGSDVEAAAVDCGAGGDVVGGGHGGEVIPGGSPGPVTRRRAGVGVKLMVVCDLDELRAGVGTARISGRGVDVPVPVSELRRLACDCGVLPVVMGGASQVLDYGRERRLVPESLRRLLERRDGGCVFAGCDQPVERCDAHHVTPWWAAGETSIDGCVLLCRRHHQLVEPAHLAGQDQVQPDPERWEVRLSDGVPVTVPPARVDWLRRPRVHERHRLRAAEQGLAWGPAA